MKGIYRKRYWKKIGIIGIAIFSLLTVFIAWCECDSRVKCMEEKEKLEKKLVEMNQLLYVANQDIPKGIVLNREVVRQEKRFTDQDKELYIEEEDFGKVLVADVKEGTCLMDMMLETVEENQRDVFISDILLSGHLEEYNRIDVRIGYGNGEDYIVLADKVIKRIQESQGMVLSLTEEEILLLASAITDVETFEDVRLYAVTYPEQGQYKSSDVTYVPKWEILCLLGKENTEGESRTALEERLLLDEKR